MSEKNTPQMGLADISRMLFITAIILTVAILARAIWVPLAFAILLSLMVLPLCNKLESWKVPRIIAVLLVVITITLLVLGFGAFMTYEMQSFLRDMPELKNYFSDAADNLMSKVRELLNISQREQEKLVEENSSSIMTPISKAFGFALATTYEAVFTTFLIPVYMVFVLYYRNKWKNFLVRTFKQYTKTDKVVSAISEVVKVSRQYIKGLLFVILIIAVMNSLGLWLLGIKYALLIGVFSAMLNIIPYLGNVVGCAIPMAIALATKESAWYALGVLGMYVFVQFIEGNFITPRVVGSQVNINPFIAVIALFTGGIIWGIAGVILAIPLTAIMRVIFMHSKTLKPIGILLSGDEVEDD